MAAGSPVSLSKMAAPTASRQGPVYQAAARADHAAITAYTAHASGAVTVTSNAATDLDTTAAALETLVDEVTTLRAAFNDLLAKLRTAGVLAS